MNKHFINGFVKAAVAAGFSEKQAGEIAGRISYKQLSPRGREYMHGLARKYGLPPKHPTQLASWNSNISKDVKKSGANPNQVADIFGDSAFHKAVKTAEVPQSLLYSLGGAGLGGISGYLSGRNKDAKKDHRWRNAALGAGLGAGLGLALNSALNKQPDNVDVAGAAPKTWEQIKRELAQGKAQRSAALQGLTVLAGAQETHSVKQGGGGQQFFTPHMKDLTSLLSWQLHPSLIGLPEYQPNNHLEGYQYEIKPHPDGDFSKNWLGVARPAPGFTGPTFYIDKERNLLTNLNPRTAWSTVYQNSLETP